MTQNSKPKANPNDVAEDTGRAPSNNDLETEPATPDSDNDEPVFLDSMSLMDELQDVKHSQPDPDHAEPNLFDTIVLIDELKQAEPSQPEPDQQETDPSPPDPVHDETVFFDSSALLDELKQAEPSEFEPDQQETDPFPPDPDHDETVFFDSGSLLDELKQTDPSQLEPDHDHRKETAAPTETMKFGNYEVVRLLGKGGFGSVWKARGSDNQPVAVKVLNPDVLENERAVRKFFHEAINMSKMDHPNICRFIDFFPHKGNYAIIMDFVQGTDLQEMLKKQNGPLPFETARLIAAQALDGFHYAHQKQVLHRDIKPENITLTTEGSTKIMDFGIARLSSSESQQTSLYMISPAYTAPERFDANKTDMVDHRADIYSLGLVFYEIFTGTHPFQTTNPTEMIVAHMSKIPTPPNEIVDLPREISDAILTALEKDPENRFEDFAAFKMKMLGEAPLWSSQFIGPIEFCGECCKDSAVFLKTLAGIVKKHQKQASKITLGQVGTQVNLIIETDGGKTLSINRDIGKQ